jgi:undecaprenyl-diphosphatase
LWFFFVTAVSDTIDPWIFSGTLVGGVLLLAAVVWLWYGVWRSQRTGSPGGAHGRTRPRLVTRRRRVRLLLQYLQARLSPQGALGLSLTFGALLLIVASWLFGALLKDILIQDLLLGMDRQVAQWLHAHATPFVTTVMLIISALGSGYAVTVIALGLALLLGWHRAWERLLVLVLTVPGGAGLNALLKHAFRRARPLFDDPLLVLTTYSFPSGHAMAATVLYGLLVVYAVRHLRQRRARLLVASAAAVLIVLVGFSRLYLGVHYLSDVLGGMAVGVVWLTMCLTAVETVRRQRRAGQTRV